MSTPAIRWGNFRGDPQLIEKMQRQLRSPRARSAVSGRLRRAAETVAADCKRIAEDELHHRPNDRRTKESLAYGSEEYHDAFVVVAPTDLGLDKLQIGVTNTHKKIMRWVEGGTKPHAIPKTPLDHNLAFPWWGRAGGHGGPRSMGPWPVEGPPFTSINEVWHPGAAKHDIMRRAMREYRRRAHRRFG